jgi:transcriptional regulator with XRE-family HTH domain
MSKNQLAQEREHRGWSKSELARRARMHPSTVGLIESGRRKPYPKELARLAKVLKWSGDPASLLEEAKDACA